MDHEFKLIYAEYIDQGFLWRLVKPEGKGGHVYRLLRIDKTSLKWKVAKRFDSFNRFVDSLPPLSCKFIYFAFFRYAFFEVSEVDQGFLRIKGVDYGKRKTLGTVELRDKRRVTKLFAEFFELD